MEKNKIRLVLADDHTLFRKGIIELLRENPEFEIVDDVGDGEQLISSYFEKKPDLIIVDIAMPGISGYQAYEKIKSIDPEVKALFLSMHSEEIYFYQIYVSGGKGLIDKNINIEELEKAIFIIMKGGRYFGNNYDDEKLQELVNRLQGKPSQESGSGIEMTKRELEILQYIKEFASNEEIAKKLEISIRTVEKHRENISKKAGIKSYLELFRFAQEFQGSSNDS